MKVPMTHQKDTDYSIKRLDSKNARAATIQKISVDFNLMSIVAETYYQQISTYFDQHADVHLTSGQICYEAVAAEEPAGKHIAYTFTEIEQKTNHSERAVYRTLVVVPYVALQLACMYR